MAPTLLHLLRASAYEERHTMKNSRVLRASTLTVGTVAAGGAWAIEPSKAYIDFCNQKAARMSTASPEREPPPMTGGATEPKPGPPGRLSHVLLQAPVLPALPNSVWGRARRGR